MSNYRSIKDHSERGYHTVQLLLTVGAGMIVWSLFTIIDDRRVFAALLVCLAIMFVGFALLAYLRRSIAYRLNQASLAEQERHMLLRDDALTGAMTRRFFLEELQRTLGTPFKPRDATLVLIDLDHFKQLNDSFGHPFGDRALVHVVSSIKQLFPDCTTGRLGGDEFAVIVRDADIDRTRARVRALLDTLRMGRLHEGHTVSLSVSAGAALAPRHAGQAEELMLLADLALYESKSAGRGRLTVFDPEMLSDKRHSRFIERELRAAIYLNQLELHYQPITNDRGSVLALEGLVRWRHPVRGMIPPGDFIPVAERSNLIGTLGEWVFRQACLDIVHFPGCRLTINVSGEQLKHDSFLLMLGRVLKETGRRADLFVLEITETVATGAKPEILRRLEAARSMGFKIALDDFGTGYCGFNYLKTLPIDSIKIDRSYIQGLGHDPVAQVFVSALVQIARIQNLAVVAEGVETEAELILARAAGCDRFQGYHISRPARKEELSWVNESSPMEHALSA
ncbi:EAL domain-containing protein [Aquamicrobium sp. LC103]|uniref:putative bifunctional diguanylate cyclase/phosphodiesterase n=1 Tax=Aquamicrobium sp. LC103 TaxID=1120658 RepID=UPI00063ED264|nr:EAL domain-containing protein [Aquamicrobium sp. LC103]TKT80378.1 EAL domain-containing protein [Aquamicrobium sp. LC103]